MSEQFSVWTESDDFSRVNSLFVMTSDGQYLAPVEGGYNTVEDKTPFMKWEPAAFNLKDLILDIYKHLIIDEASDRDAVNPHHRMVFLEEIGSVERRSRRPR